MKYMMRSQRNIVLGSDHVLRLYPIFLGYLLALSDVCRPALASHCHTFGQPRRRLRLHPIQSFETGLKFVHWLNCAIGPFGLYFPMLAIFKNHTKYRSSRRHVFTYMMARRE